MNKVILIITLFNKLFFSVKKIGKNLQLHKNKQKSFNIKNQIVPNLNQMLKLQIKI